MKKHAQNPMNKTQPAGKSLDVRKVSKMDKNFKDLGNSTSKKQLG